MTADDSEKNLQPRDRCPDCGGAVHTESVDPLEEYCLNYPCEYYRAAGGPDGVIRE